jgi:hypothetical protein
MTISASIVNMFQMESGRSVCRTMRRTLKTFVIPAGKPAGTPPEPGPDVEFEAPTEDALLAAAHEALAKLGQRARAVSFTPTGLVAYAEAAR